MGRSRPAELIPHQLTPTALVLSVRAPEAAALGVVWVLRRRRARGSFCTSGAGVVELGMPTAPTAGDQQAEQAERVRRVWS